MRLELKLLALVVCTLIGLTIANARKARKVGLDGKTSARLSEDVNRRPEKAYPDTERDCQPYKKLYFKLHRLEQHADILPRARSLLLRFLSKGLEAEGTESALLSIQEFSIDALDAFVQEELDAVTRKWKDYLDRRKAGQPREMFQTIEAARRWLVRMAPAKLVDGAWLGHIHKITTPFAMRRITKAAWQVMSEELGDGDLAKSHVHLYAQLLRQVGSPVCAPEDAQFIRQPGMDDYRVWRCAVAQLLISLFPHEFLPEILGFNMHFEMLTLETLKTAKELRELGLDPYYFTLHIAIDNADTGHTAMASHVVADYLQSVAVGEGQPAARQAWRRVQAGFILSKNLPADMDSPTHSSPLADEVLSIFHSKARVAHQIHAHCPMTLGGRPISSWLELAASSTRERQADFLRCLSDAQPWIYRGDSARSRLVRLLSWGGSMFGAFTDRETGVLRDWIDSLVPPGAGPYKQFTGRTNLNEDTLPKMTLHSNYPVINPMVSIPLEPFKTLESSKAVPISIDTSRVQMHRLLPLWFAHQSLLEGFACVPSRTASLFGCAAVRFLRAQYGFLPEPEIVAGTDESGRASHVDLVDVGLELASRADSSSSPAASPPQSLAHVLERCPCPFADTMLGLSMRPLEYQWVLLGMALAFTQLHGALASARPAILSTDTAAALQLIVRREQDSLSVYMADLKQEDPGGADFWHGHAVARGEIDACFGSLADMK